MRSNSAIAAQNCAIYKSCGFVSYKVSFASYSENLLEICDFAQHTPPFKLNAHCRPKSNMTTEESVADFAK